MTNILVIEFMTNYIGHSTYDQLKKKVFVVRQWRSAVDQLFLVAERSQMNNHDHSVTNIDGLKLANFL